MDEEETTTELLFTGSEAALQAFGAAIVKAPHLPHTHKLATRFKPCGQRLCVECLAHDLQTYTGLQHCFISPTLTFRLVTDLALRLVRPSLLAAFTSHFPRVSFDEAKVQIGAKAHSLDICKKLQERIERTAVAMLQWHYAHLLVFGRNAICVLPRLHWTHVDSQEPEVDYVRTGRMMGQNEALEMDRRYAALLVYGGQDDAAPLAETLTQQQTDRWAMLLPYLTRLRNITIFESGFPSGDYPQVTVDPGDFEVFSDDTIDSSSESDHDDAQEPIHMDQ